MAASDLTVPPSVYRASVTQHVAMPSGARVLPAHAAIEGVGAGDPGGETPCVVLPNGQRYIPILAFVPVDGRTGRRGPAATWVDGEVQASDLLTLMGPHTVSLEPSAPDAINEVPSETRLAAPPALRVMGG